MGPDDNGLMVIIKVDQGGLTIGYLTRNSGTLFSLDIVENCHWPFQDEEKSPNYQDQEKCL